MAEPRPSGAAIIIDQNVISKVPESNGSIPKCFGMNKGVHFVSVRKFMIETSLKKLNVSNANDNIIPIVVAIGIMLQSNKNECMNFSLSF